MRVVSAKTLPVAALDLGQAVVAAAPRQGHGHPGALAGNLAVAVTDDGWPGSTSYSGVIS